MPTAHKRSYRHQGYPNCLDGTSFSIQPENYLAFSYLEHKAGHPTPLALNQ
uniref:Uncharacterized protein n=1 Tax=Rhizophora mucronata TaxID=61149 RepID=A0A2P2MQ05_RHIMU